MALGLQHMFFIRGGDGGRDTWLPLFAEGVHFQLESPEGQGLVPGLRPMFRGERGNTRGEMTDPYRRLPLVFMLPARA